MSAPEGNIKYLQSLQYLFSTTQDFISLVDIDYRYVLVNDAYLKLNNKSREEIVGKTVAELVGKEIFAEKIKDKLDHCLDDNIINFQEWFEYTGAGRRFMDVSYIPYRDDQDKVIGVFVNGRDITELTNSIQAQKDAEKRVQLMSQAGNIGLWDWDLRTDNVYFSPQWKKQLGYKDNEISNHYHEWESRLHPHDMEKAISTVRSFHQDPYDNYRNEFRLRHKDGSYRWIMATASLLHDNKGNPVRMLGAHIDITEHKEKEEALQKSEEILKKAQGVAHIGSWWYTQETMIPGWTDETFRIFGLEPGKQAPSLVEHKKYIHSDDWEMFDVSLIRAIKEGIGYNLEMRLIRPDGEIRYVHAICETVKTTNGYGYKLIGTLQDITQRKNDLQALEITQKKYQDLFESFRDAILVANTERTIIDCNQALLDIFGYEKEEILGQQTKYLYESEQQFIEMGNALKKHSGDNSFLYTIDYRKKSAETFPGETGFFYLKDSAGEIYGYIGLIRDISERLKSEKLLRRSEEQFRSMVENLFDAVVVSNVDGTIQFANRAATDLFGRSGNELLGRTLGLPTSLESTHEIEIVQEAGTIRYAEVKVSPVKWANEEVYLASIRDTTDKVLVRMEREKHRENLQQLQRIEAIGTLAGGIAHDFNNILTPILGFTELAMDRVKNDEFVVECLDEVYQSATRAKDLVGQILAFSRQGKESYRPIIVEPIVREVLKLIRAGIPTSIAIHLDIESRGMIIGDETEIHQILMNLCTNAKHAMEEAGGDLRVSLRDLKITDTEKPIHPDLQEGRYLHLQVSDSGCGMERSVLEKIFEPYFTTKGKEKGTGLGLSVVHGIVLNHNGVITVHSELNQGTTFDIYLPRTATKKETRFEAETEIVGGTERILVVDDELQILKLHERLLKSLGYEVTTRVNSLEALQLFEKKAGEFDLLLTDMTMPGMTGDTLAEKCMVIRPDLPVIIITGFSEKLTDEKAARLGIKALVLKPVTKSQMAGAIRSALQKTTTN